MIALTSACGGFADVADARFAHPADSASNLEYTTDDINIYLSRTGSPSKLKL